MSKNLLTEGEIRKMMKFANLSPLSENFIDRIDEDEMFGEAEDEAPIDDPAAAAGDEDPEMDMGAEEDPEGAEDLEEWANPDSVVQEVARRVAKRLLRRR